MSEEMQNCSMDILNDDCLQLILSQFGTIADFARFEGVSKRWKRLMFPMWKKISVLDCTESATISWGVALETLERSLNITSSRRILQRCGDGLKGFDTSNSLGLSHTFLNCIGEYCPNLEFAKVRGCNCDFTVPENGKSLTACKKLRKFSIVHLNDEDTLSQIFLSLKNLRSVEIQGDTTNCSISVSLLSLPSMLEEIQFENVSINSDCLNSALKHLPNLKSIVIDNCSPLSSDVVLTITRIESLRTLKLSGSNIFLEPMTCGYFLANVRNLEVFEVLPLERHLLKEMVETGPLLMDIGAELQYLITNATLLSIARDCRKLRCLDITGPFKWVEDRIIEQLVSLKGLRTLKLNYNLQVTDESLSKFTQLNHLSCIGCLNVSDGGIIEMMRKSPKLESLDLCNTFISEATVRSAIDIVAERKSVPLKLAIGYTDAITIYVSLDDYNRVKPPLLEIIDGTLL